MVEYFPCQVAFLDVLGWKNLVNRSVRDLDLRRRMASALIEAPQAIHYPGGTPGQRTGAPQVGQFSDSIIISHNFGGGEPWHMESFYFILWRTCFYLGKSGLFVRGGVGNGLMHHNGVLAFGPALTAAAELEKEARVPRVLMPLSLIPNARGEGDLPHHQYGLVRQRPPDNKPFFDYLAWDHQWDTPLEPDGAQRSVRNKLDVAWRPPILAALREHSSENSNLRVLGKYVWLADYFNEVAQEVGAGPIDLTAIIGSPRHLRRARRIPFLD